MTAAQQARTHLHVVLREANKYLQLSHAFRYHGKLVESWSYQATYEQIAEHASAVESALRTHNLTTSAANDNFYFNDPNNSRRTQHHAR